MKVAVTFWGTGEYINFLPEWYERLEEYFLPDVEKNYFVFTDGELDGTPENITLMIYVHEENTLYGSAPENKFDW